jgi:hypothetical protein
MDANDKTAQKSLDESLRKAYSRAGSAITAGILMCSIALPLAYLFADDYFSTGWFGDPYGKMIPREIDVAAFLFAVAIACGGAMLIVSGLRRARQTRAAIQAGEWPDR